MDAADPPGRRQFPEDAAEPYRRPAGFVWQDFDIGPPPLAKAGTESFQNSLLAGEADGIGGKSLGAAAFAVALLGGGKNAAGETGLLKGGLNPFYFDNIYTDTQNHGDTSSFVCGRGFILLIISFFAIYYLPAGKNLPRRSFHNFVTAASNFRQTVFL
jgi:hypothetical protein